MTSFAVHNRNGDIKSVVRSSVGAPPVAAPDPELFVTEIEPPQGLFDFGNPEEQHRAVEALKSYRISQGKMIRRP